MNRLCAVLVGAAYLLAGARAHAELTVIASEASSLGLVLADEPPAIATSGVVAFVGAIGPRAAGDRRDVFFADGSTSTARALGIEGRGLADVSSVAVGDMEIAFLAKRASAVDIEVRGAWVAPLRPGTAPTLLFEGPVLADVQRGPTPWAEIAMSPGGTIAFNALYDLYGALYRRRPGGSVEVLQIGPAERPSGLGLHRAYALDVNDFGVIAIDAELYCDAAPWCQGIQHAVYLLSNSGQNTRNVTVSAARACGSVAIDNHGATTHVCGNQLVVGDATPFLRTPVPRPLDAWPVSTEPARVDRNARGEIAYAKPGGIFLARAEGGPPSPVVLVGERVGNDEVLGVTLGGINARGQIAALLRVRRPDGREDRRIVRMRGYVSVRPPNQPPPGGIPGF